MLRLPVSVRWNSPAKGTNRVDVVKGGWRAELKDRHSRPVHLRALSEAPRGINLFAMDVPERLHAAAEQRLRRRNTRILIRYGIVVVAVVVLEAALFQAIMRNVEGQQHDWLTGLYWTLSTMTTLGLGDIVFTSLTGRIFTVAVLLSGIVLVFVVFPFAFIRFFYAPWLGARRVPSRVAGHVIITAYDNVAPGMIEKLEARKVPYFVIEPDPFQASRLHEDGISVFTGDVDSRLTYERLRANHARLVLANCEDTTNTNIILTVREVARDVCVVALANSEASIDILEFSGATHVFTLRQRLGEQLAQRLNAGRIQTHVIGTFRDLVIAEFPLHNTPFAGRPVREVGFREALGVNVIGVIEHTKFRPVGPETVFSDHSVPVVVGTREQMQELDELLLIYEASSKPVVVVGGGLVGRAATRMLKQSGVTVHMVEKDSDEAPIIGTLPDRLVLGDAAEREVLMEAGLAEAPGVIISTNDDAMNIYLTLYCRRLAPDIRIVSRITHERNLEAIQRAGADLALSHTSLGVGLVFSALRGGGELVTLGEKVELHELPLPARLSGVTLKDAGIATRTGLNVIAIQSRDGLVPNPDPNAPLESDDFLFVIGNQEQVEAFTKTFG